MENIYQFEKQWKAVKNEWKLVILRADEMIRCNHYFNYDISEKTYIQLTGDPGLTDSIDERETLPIQGGYVSVPLKNVLKIVDEKDIIDKFDKSSKKKDVIKMKVNYQLWVIWKTECRGCGKDITVAMNLNGYILNPYSEESNEECLTYKEINEDIEYTLKEMGASRKPRYDHPRYAHMTNVCPYCNTTQTTGYLLKDILSFYRENFPEHAKLLLFKNGRLLKKYSNYDELEEDYKRGEFVDD